MIKDPRNTLSYACTSCSIAHSLAHLHRELEAGLELDNKIIEVGLQAVSRGRQTHLAASRSRSDESSLERDVVRRDAAGYDSPGGSYFVGFHVLDRASSFSEGGGRCMLLQAS